MKTAVVKQLYEYSSRGEWDAQRPLLTDDYKHHLVGQGVDLDGPDAAIEAVRSSSEALHMTWTSDRVEEHGDFAVSFSTGEIAGMSPFKALNIYRFSGDRIAEAWVIVPPLG